MLQLKVKVVCYKSQLYFFVVNTECLGILVKAGVKKSYQNYDFTISKSFINFYGMPLF